MIDSTSLFFLIAVILIALAFDFANGFNDAANAIATEDIVSAFFTVTTDLNADYPAAAARVMGWTQVPLLDAQEIEVPGTMPRVIRVMLHIETERTQAEIKHIYLGDAANLRSDIAGAQ